MPSKDNWTIIERGEREQIMYIERDDKKLFQIMYFANSNQFETYNDVFIKTLNSFKKD